MREKTINLSSFVYGEKGMPLNDPGEAAIANSKLTRININKELIGSYTLENVEALAQSATRSVKKYPHRPSIQLSTPMKSNKSFLSVINDRRSFRKFHERNISLEELSTFLHIGSGVTNSFQTINKEKQEFRTIPSGGALYPHEVYLYAYNSDFLPKGIYHFNSSDFILEEVYLQNLDKEIIEASNQPEYFENAQFVIFINGIFSRSRFKYGNRGFRFTMLEVGHVAQNLALGAEFLDIGTVSIGGFFDYEVESILQVDGIDEAPLYMMIVGSKNKIN